MPPAGFETAIPAGDRPQTLAWDRWAIGIGWNSSFETKLTALETYWDLLTST
jgi:hypothetical protein